MVKFPVIPAGLLLASLLLVSGSAWSQIRGCGSVAPPAEIVIDVKDGPVVYQSVRSMAESSAREGAYNRAIGIHTMGLTSVQYINGFSTELGMVGPPGLREVCMWVKKISIRIGFDRQTIRILERYRPGSCQYRVINAHELQHVEFNRKALHAYAPRIRAALADAARRLGTLSGQPNRLSAIFNANLSTAFNRQVQSMLTTAGNYHATIDSPSAYAITSRQCPSW